MIALPVKHSTNRTPSIHRTRLSGFSLVELMVVISIIAVLVGLLLVALGRVRTAASITRTKNTMQQFAAACDQFQQEYGRYPGVIPEPVLASLPNNPLSTTENALLELMGGYRVLKPGEENIPAIKDDYDAYSGTVIALGPVWRLKVDVNRIGEGPFIDGKANGPFLAPDENAFGLVSGQALGASFNALELPDLLDDWGQPIIYLRRLRSRGPLFFDIPNDLPQFLIAGLDGYLKSPGLGELGQNQDYDSSPGGSILTDSLTNFEKNYAYVLRHPALGSSDPNEVRKTSTARGAYVLISAGPDGIFFSAQDGPGAPGDEVTALGGNPDINPDRAVDEYDDIRIFGGG
ncbi:MAG: prepilin-type N-terminal cleavage/methylation domain-containing protein [Planctomycetes bacterium]|nr:prepilin-type N-terminal cleavage/methylation domain-containing protein [Planctomycetota bacterium]